MTANEPSRPSVWLRWRGQLLALFWLVLVWNLLWGEITWANVIGGFLVATAVLTVFPLPPVTFAGHIWPGKLARFGIRFLADLIVASVQLAWIALRPGPPPRGAIIAVPLRVPNDLTMTLTAEALSLIPGTLNIEADPRTGTLYLHCFGIRDIAQVERVRRDMLRLEARIVEAVGSPEERRQLQSSVRE